MNIGMLRYEPQFKKYAIAKGCIAEFVDCLGSMTMFARTKVRIHFSDDIFLKNPIEPPFCKVNQTYNDRIQIVTSGQTYDQPTEEALKLFFQWQYYYGGFGTVDEINMFNVKPSKDTIHKLYILLQWARSMDIREEPVVTVRMFNLPAEHYETARLEVSIKCSMQEDEIARLIKTSWVQS